MNVTVPSMCLLDSVNTFVLEPISDLSFCFLFQCIINFQALPCLLNLLKHNYKKSIKKEACWTISNITAGNINQIQVNWPILI